MASGSVPPGAPKELSTGGRASAPAWHICLLASSLRSISRRRHTRYMLNRGWRGQVALRTDALCSRTCRKRRVLSSYNDYYAVFAEPSYLGQGLKYDASAYLECSFCSLVGRNYLSHRIECCAKRVELTFTVIVPHRSVTSLAVLGSADTPKTSWVSQFPRMIVAPSWVY